MPYTYYEYFKVYSLPRARYIEIGIDEKTEAFSFTRMQLVDREHLLLLPTKMGLLLLLLMDMGKLDVFLTKGIFNAIYKARTKKTVR